MFLFQNRYTFAFSIKSVRDKLCVLLMSCYHYFVKLNITVSVGFTEENINLTEGVTGQICLTTYDHIIHQSISLNFTLQLQDNIEGTPE